MNDQSESSQPDRSSQTRSEFERAAEQKQPSLAAELWQFITENKAWWLVPIVVVLGLMGLLIFFGSTGAAPFIYTLL